MMLSVLISVLLTIYYVYSICPNNCSGHGSCKNSVCSCYQNVGLDKSESFTGFDCSMRRCFLGNPFGAVHSKLVGSGGLTSYNPDYRELYDLSTVNRQMSDEPPSVKLDGEVNTGDKTLWKVHGLETFTDILPLTGGILSCRYYKADALQSKPNTINVISYTDKYQYVLFEKSTEKVNNNPDSIKIDNVEYSKVVCDDIISIRNDLSQLISVTVTVTVASSPRRLLSNNTTRQLETTVTAKSTMKYGSILKDMGLLKEKSAEESSTYENTNFRLACYPTTTPSPISTSTPITKYDKVTASYDGTNEDITFTFDKENDIPSTDNTYFCVCLMDSDGLIEIEDAEIYSNIRKDDDNSYKIGKYAAVGSGEIKSEYEFNHVVIVTDAIAEDKKITIADSEDINAIRYLNEGRVVYATILTNGIFKEEPVEMGSGSTIGKITTTDGDVMPYIRTYPMSPLTELPSTAIVKQNAPSATTLYKAYYFAENLLYSLKKEGGILKCSYTTTPRERILAEPIEIEIDVKGIVKDPKNNEIIYSYIEYNKDVNMDLSKGTLECSSIKSIRNDLTTYNSLATLDISGSRARQLSIAKMAWAGYGDMITDLDFFKTENDKKKLACYKAGGIIEVKEYTVTSKIDISSDVVFTLTDTTLPTDAKYECFAAMRYDGSDVLLENSDMKDKIIKDGSTYYYGDFIPPKDAIKLQKKDDGTEAIVLDSAATITLTDSNPKTVTLTLTNSIPKELNDYFKNNKSFKLKIGKKCFTLRRIDN